MKISVVIPIYKVEKYLRQCVDSVLNQTYRDLEIILVDDGSPDSCPQICNEYAMQDDRVVVIHKENGGLSSARRAGISCSSGHYITIVDADDWIDDTAIEECVKAIHANPDADCVIFSYRREYPNASIVSHVMDGSKTFRGIETEYAIYRRLFGLYGDELRHPERLESLGSCCMKLYRADAAQRARYFDTKEVGSSEDTLFNIYALRGVTHVVYLDKPFYHYRKTGQSISSTYRPNLICQWNRLFDIMTGAIQDFGLDETYHAALNTRIALSVLGIGLNELNGRESFNCRVGKVRDYLSSERYQQAVRVVPIKKTPMPWWVLLTLSKYRLAYPVCMELLMIDKFRKKH